MDATENDIPPQAGFRVSGFPTIKFRAAGTAEWIDYAGDRSLESLIEFVEENKLSAGGGGEPVKRTTTEEGEAVVGEVEEDDVFEHDEL